MNTITIMSNRRTTANIPEVFYIQDNKISSIRINLPQKIGDYELTQCSIELRACIDDDYISYEIPTNNKFYDWQPTTDITEKSRTVNLVFYITADGGVIGRTKPIQLNIQVNPDKGEELTPREQFDTVIREQRQTIQEQSQTISTQGETITQQGEQITELNSEVSTLEGTVSEQQATITRQNQTIDQLNSRVPALEQLDPINPSGIQQTYNPESPNIGFPQVIVNPVTAEGINFHPEYYKEGEECVGKVGTYNPFPENSYGGIYYTELGEGGYPKKILIKDMLRSASTIPPFFDASNDAKRELREIIFENCPGFLTTGTSLFLGFNYLTKVLLPDSLTSIGNGAFQNCTSLTELTLPDSLTSIGGGAFQNCTSLTEINLPDSLTSIGGNAFFNCTSLTEINLPNSLTRIDGNAFQYCTSLTEINLPDSLTSIGSNAFRNCTSLTGLTLAQGFNCNGLNVSDSTRFTAETIVACLEALADRTGQTAYTITFGSTNLNKLTAEQKAIATNKNWNLA